VQTSKKALLLASLLSLNSNLVFANDNNTSLDFYISDLKKEQFKYDYKKNEAESSKVRDSWIAPLSLTYTHTKSDSNPYAPEQETKTAMIKMDQPIFQSGGIYYGIKFANASKEYTDYSIDVAKRKMIKDAIALLMQIKQSDLKIERQKLQIKNSEISLEQKKEQYLNGQLDSGFLDNAVIERNFVIQSLYDIETAKERLISSFSVLSDLNYETVKIPYLELLNREEFLKYNIVLEMAEAQIQRDRYSKNMTITQYLPAVNLTAGYTWTESSNGFFANGERKFYDYGFRASMPININTFRDIESAKIDYLKSEVTKKDTKIKLDALFTQVMQNLENLDKKKLLSLENKELYTKLLEDTKELYRAGYKTEYDVSLLENSVNIADLDSKIYEIDKQLELLNLYEMYVNESL
jgi:outer membrane protein TolC